MSTQEIHSDRPTTWIRRALVSAMALLAMSLLFAANSDAGVKLSGGRHVLMLRARHNGSARTKKRVVRISPTHSSEPAPTSTPIPTPTPEPTPSPEPAPESTEPSEEATEPAPAPEAPEQPAPESNPAPEPAPEAPVEPATPSGKKLFSSDFSKGLTGWSLGGVGEAIPKVVNSSEGPYCEVTLEGTQGRSELIMGEDLHIVEGETVLYEFEEFIVPGFAYGSRALGWNLFTQFKSDGEGSPMFGLDLWNEGGKKGLWVEPEPDPNYFVAPMAEGVWHKIAIQITGSSHEAGGWVLSLDGNEVDRRTGRSTIRPGKTFAYIKNGLYRSGVTIDATSKLRVRDVSLYELSS